MHERRWLAVSLLLNLALGLWLWRSAHPTAPPAAPTPSLSSNQVTTVVRTNTVIRRQNFLWSDIESDDYVTYIQNLRLIACPEATVRDIIVADVNQLFAQRRATELATPQQQWWRSTADPEVARAAAAAAMALEKERRDLLTQLLGPDWESADYPFPSAFAQSTLDGPLLGSLSPETKAAIHEIERSEQARLSHYLDEVAAAGESPDSATLVQLQLESREALRSILRPEELEEYLLRYAPTATQLRSTLSGIEISPEEFRSLFRTLDPLELQLAVNGSTSAESARQQEALSEQKQTALLQILGEERFEAYQLAQDTLYQKARTLVTQVGVGDDQIVPVAAIVRLTEEEELRIRNDPRLSSEERLEQLQAARELQLGSLRQLLGSEAFERYLEMKPDVWENAQQ